MWDTVQTSRSRLSHDLPCPGCGHAAHTYLPCSDLLSRAARREPARDERGADAAAPADGSCQAGSATRPSSATEASDSLRGTTRTV